MLELGCGTGRIALPLARAGVSLVGIDRSERMLERAARRLKLLYRGQPARKRRKLRLIRGDIRTLPFADGGFEMVLAPYGILQSLLRDKDLASTLQSVARVLRPGGLFGLDLVPDVPNWREYTNKIQLRGKAAGGRHLTLVETVRQDQKRRLTTFQQTYLERRDGEITEHQFGLTFRTLPVRLMTRRLKRAGFDVEAVLGDYQGGPWMSGPTSGSCWRGGAGEIGPEGPCDKIFRPISLISQEFQHVRPFQVAHNQAQEGRR